MAGKKKIKKQDNSPLHVDSAEFAVKEAMRMSQQNVFKPESVESEYKSYDPKPDQVVSSIPIDGFKTQTEGLQPRSRVAATRDAATRTKEEEIRYYSQNLGRTAGDRLAIPKEMIPVGYSFLWARASVRDRPDVANLSNLHKKGWRYATADELPGQAFQDHFHGIRDDAEHVYNAGLVAMLRYEELTQRELSIFKQNSDNQTKALTAKYRSESKDLHPFAINERENYQDPFLVHHPVGADFRSSLADF